MQSIAKPLHHMICIVTGVAIAVTGSGCAHWNRTAPCAMPCNPHVPTSRTDTQIKTVSFQTDLDGSEREMSENPPSVVVPNQQPPIAPSELTSEQLPIPNTENHLRSESVHIADIAESIHATFPLLEAAYQQSRIAAGNQIAAWGSFDTKLKAASESGPLGFYETYRNSAGLVRPLYYGGEVFGGYRIGRGNFQPWYLERQTNDGGEFKAGFRVPLLRNRELDARRAELWRATYDRRRAEPEIRAQLVGFVRDGSIAYWNWIAAGRKYEIGKRVLTLAEQRNTQLKRKVELGDIDPPVLQDNLRTIAKREAKLIDLRRKLQQSAIKLSLFYRTSDGQPVIAEESQLVDFPNSQPVDLEQTETDVVTALASRPELVALDLLVRRVKVDLAEARNDMLPTVDAQIVGSQDVGTPTSKKRDKSEFELEAGIFVDVPLQRRKAVGKVQASCGKLAQLAARRRFTIDKIRAEVQSAYTSLAAAGEKLDRARESRRLADYIAVVENRKFELGQSDLLAVALREQYAIEAAEAEVDALLEYFIAKTDYGATLARDWPLEFSRLPNP